MTLFNTVKTRLSQRLHYRRTLNALSAQPRETAQDLGIARRDIPALAHNAVYGS